MANLEAPQTGNQEQERNAEHDRLAFLEAVRTVEIGEIDTEFDEKSVESLVAELGEAKLFLLGEMHGVKENADIIYTLFKKFGFQKLALEWDKNLQEQANNFLQTGEIEFNAIKDNPDGRITAGHLVLLRKLKDEGLLEGLICFAGISPRAVWDVKDANMAKHILANFADSMTLVVAGNLHTQVGPVVFADETEEHHPMGERIKEEVPNVPSGSINYLSGRYHNYGAVDFEDKLDSRELPRARFYKSVDGTYSFDLPKAHLAVVPNPSERLPQDS